MNKERGAQLAEAQYLQQEEIEQDARIDMAMLRQKEIEEANEREIRKYPTTYICSFQIF